MATRRENVSSLFQNARTRTIIIVTAVIVFGAVFVGYIRYRIATRTTPAQAAVAQIPSGIRSIPGSLKPTEQYATLQEKQNIEEAKRAQKAGTSAIPTIIRTQQLSEGQQVPGQAAQGVGFTRLAQEQQGGTQKSLWFENLKNSRCSPEAIKQAQQFGATVKDLREAGCSACQLKAAGYSAADLAVGGYTDGELKGAGFSPDAIKDSGTLPEGVTSNDIARAGCSVAALRREREQGISATAIKRFAGCGAAALKAAGYTAKELLNAGFTPKQLKDTGFTARDLKNAGLSDAQLKAAGFTPSEIQAASGVPSGVSLDSIKKAGCSVDALKKLRAEGVSAAAIRRASNCSAAALKAAGYTAKQLKDAGFTAKQLKDAGFTASQLKAAGFTAKQLKDAGFTAKQLKDAGFTAGQLKSAGFTAKQLKDAGFTPKQLKDAGFTAKQLVDAGLTPEQLKNAGFTAKQLKDAGLSNDLIRSAGYSPAELSQAGITAPSPIGAPVTPTTVTGEPLSNQQLQNVLAHQAAQISQEKLQQELQNIEGRMAGQAQQLFTTWQSPNQTSVVGTPPQKPQAGTKAGAAAGAAGAAAASGAGKVMIKAGTIIFAVLDTSINSDEPGPVLAHIVTGKFKGAKIIGKITVVGRNQSRVTLNFNLMSLPNLGKTFPINAFAIDPTTARTALSSSTNHHYLERYGALFASSFMEGFGQSFQSKGQTVIIDGGTQATTISDTGLSSKENAIVGMAKLGQRWGEQVGQNFNRPPTVQVYSGTGMGILFAQDVASPFPQKQ